MKKHYTNLTEADFKNIKLMQQAGLSSGMAAKIVGRSTSTVGYIYRSETLEGYHELVRTMRSKINLPPTVPADTSILEVLLDIQTRVKNLEIMHMASESALGTAAKKPWFKG